MGDDAEWSMKNEIDCAIRDRDAMAAARVRQEAELTRLRAENERWKGAYATALDAVAAERAAHAVTREELTASRSSKLEQWGELAAARESLRLMDAVNGRLRAELAAAREALRQADDVAYQALHDLDELRLKHRFCEPAAPPDDLRAEVARLRAELEQCADDVPDSAEIARAALAAPPAPAMQTRLQADRAIDCPSCSAKAGEWCKGLKPDSTAICIARSFAVASTSAPAAAPAPPVVPPVHAHVQTIVNAPGSPYYYRSCSCGWQGLPRHLEDATNDQCPASLTRLAQCGHPAYRDHDDMCINDGCPHAAYQVAPPPAVPEKCGGYCRPPGEACSAQCARRLGHEGRCSCKPDASPSAVLDKRGTCLGCGGTGGLGAICPNCAGTGRAPTGGGR